MKKKEKDFLSVLNKVRNKRNQTYKKVFVAAGAAVIMIVVISSGLAMTRVKKKATPSNAEQQSETVVAESSTEPYVDPVQLEIENVINSYNDLGLTNVTGYLYMREEPDKNGKIIGKLYGGSAVDIIESANEEWYKVRSGGLEGYVFAQHITTKDEAKQQALELVKERAIVQTERLNIRSEASTEAEIVGAAYKGERYEILEDAGDWVKIEGGYLSKEFLEIKYALNEARKLDLRSMVLNLYDNLAISNVEGYLNIREEPKEDGKIIGKLTSRAAGDIIETLDGWYKIRSGPITGYVKSDYILTGQAAKDAALEEAELMAVVTADALYARAEPNTNSKIFTTISNSEKYPIVSQSDGWIEIELEDNNNAFLSTEFVDVRYALNEAIKFTPAEDAANAIMARRNEIVGYAMQFLGNPYVWGGTSLTNGCDCSGFTMQILGKYGVGLPHYSVSQSQMGTKIDSSQMKPGDLIFYSNRSGVINHVSMYIGNGQVIHAASRKSGIKISAWNYRNPTTIRNATGD